MLQRSRARTGMEWSACLGTRSLGGSGREGGGDGIWQGIGPIPEKNVQKTVAATFSSGGHPPASTGRGVWSGAEPSCLYWHRGSERRRNPLPVLARRFRVARNRGASFPERDFGGQNHGPDVSDRDSGVRSRSPSCSERLFGRRSRLPSGSERLFRGRSRPPGGSGSE